MQEMWEMWAWSLNQEDPLEKGMATHSSILAWRIPWTEESGGLQSMGSQRVRQYWVTNTHFQGFPGGTVVKESASNVGDLGLIPGLEDLLDKGVAIHSSILAWRIPCTEEPGGLQSRGLQRVGHNWSYLAHMQFLPEEEDHPFFSEPSMEEII